MATFFCKVGGNIGDIGEVSYQWGADDKAYDGIGALLQVKKISSKVKPGGVVVAGAYKPRPAKFKIIYSVPRVGEGADNDSKRSARRMGDPDVAGKASTGELVKDGKAKVNVRGTNYPITEILLA